MKSFALVLLSLLAPAGATLPGSVPAGCTANTSVVGSVDVPGDYRCAGMAIQFHTGGVARSPSPIWAGQWLFTDPQGRFRKGWCIFNRGTHPTIAVSSHAVALTLPNDPGGRRAAYLAWRYGDVRDPLTAAGLWAVFHFYAADAAGTNRGANPNGPLVARLDRLAAASGRPDLQATAIALDAEAATYAAKWNLRIAVDGEGRVDVSLLAGDTPVPGATVQVLVSGVDAPLSLTTGADGRASVTVPLPPGAVTVAATTAAPGTAQAYRGVPAAPNPNGAQVLLVAGPPVVLRALATRSAPPPTTTTSTTTPAPPTTTPATTTTTTTTTVPPTTTTVPPTTAPAPVVPAATTTTSTTTTTTTVPAPPPSSSVPPAPTTVPATAPHPPLPRTGVGGDGRVAQLATAFLVGGIGLLGTLRRRATGRARAT